MIQELTRGHPASLIVKFALPLLIGNIFQQLYQISDIVIVGRLIGVEALAALGASAPIFFVTLLVTLGFTGGLTVVTAQRFGARDEKGLRRSVTHSLMACMVLGLVCTAFLLIFLRKILYWMSVPENIMTDAYDFMFVLGLALPVIVAYNLLSGFIRALGDSKTPLYFLIATTVVNVLLNFFLISVCKLGVIGSATGTIISITISGVCCLLYIRHKFPILRLRREDWIYDKEFMKEHLKIAVPMAIQFSVLSIGLLIIQKVCNSFGSDTIAAFTAALRIEQLATQPLVALGIAMATFSAQNFGAGMIKRIRSGVLYTSLMSFGFSIFIALLVRFVGEDMLQIFSDEITDEIITAGRQYLNISTLFYFFLGQIFIFRNTLQGMGQSVIPLISGFTELLMRSFAAIWLASSLGYIGICWASPIAWVGASLVVSVGYFVTIRRMNRRYLRNNLRMAAYKFGLIKPREETPAPILTPAE